MAGARPRAHLPPAGTVLGIERDGPGRPAVAHHRTRNTSACVAGRELQQPLDACPVAAVPENLTRLADIEIGPVGVNVRQLTPAYLAIDLRPCDYFGPIVRVIDHRCQPRPV